MSVLSSAVGEYLTLRRTLGFKLAGVGHNLQQFVRFAESEGAEWVTTDLALRWAAAHLPPPTGLRAATYATLFGLLAVTGMRISEPIGLECIDVDLEQGSSLSIRGAKFGNPWTPCFLIDVAGRSAATASSTWSAAVASQRCPSLEKKRITPHVLRHYSESRTMPSAPGVTLV